MNQEGKWVLKTTGTYCSLPKWPEPESRGLLYTFFTFFPQECHQETETLWVQASEKDEGKGRHFVLHPIRVELASPHWNEKRRELRGKRSSFVLVYVFKVCYQLFSENRLRPQERRNRFCHRSPDQSPLQNFRTQIFSRPQDLVFPHSISHKNRKSGTFQFSSGQPGAST